MHRNRRCDSNGDFHRGSNRALLDLNVVARDSDLGELLDIPAPQF